MTGHVLPPEGLRTTSDPVEGATQLVLVRHGQGAVNVTGVIGGVVGCSGLTDLGRSQVRALSDRLALTGELAPSDALYSSVLPRAKETARMLASSVGIDEAAIIEDCGLCELHPGVADGLVWEDYVKRFDAPDWDLTPDVPLSEGGESWTGFVARASTRLEHIAQKHQGQRVVIATHAGVIEASLLRFLVGTTPGLAQQRLRLRTAPASLTEWEYSEVGWKLLRYNDAAVGLTR